MQILNMIFYTAITLGALIFIHEFGHFIAAKLTGMRVDRFSIGFPPRAFGKKIGDTDYCVSWIPIGGYVKIAGMIDESFDTDFIKQEPQPWEFRSKPIWSRIFVISAGVVMNVLLAIVIFWSLHYINGSYVAETTEIGSVSEGSAFEKAGLLAGDKILSINNKNVKSWDEVQNLIYLENLGNDINMEIERNNNRVQVFIPAKSIAIPSETQAGITVGHTISIIDAVEANMPADKLGLKSGDVIISVDSIPAGYPRVVSLIRQRAGKSITLSWKRGEQIQTGTVNVTPEGRIGIKINARYVGPYRHIEYTIIQALPEGIKEIGQSLRLFYLTISKLFAGKVSIKESFGGPIAIAQMATQSAESGILVFVWFMAQLSVSLAILNILPIPALDGGHLVIMMYEQTFRREIPPKVKIVIQQIGFILLLAFMAFIVYNDISKF